MYSLSSFAQSPGSIKGIVREKSNPVEYANVFLTLRKDTTRIVTGIVTDSLGGFLLEELPNENYVLNIKMIGFAPKQIPVSITPPGQGIEDIILTPR